MKPPKRNNRDLVINALTNAQKLVFAPIAFQALASMLDFGIIEFLDKTPATEDDIITSLKLDEYIVRTLLQAGLANDILKCKDDKYSLTKMGKMFLYDDMTKVNFNFVRDVYYLGASELTSSFREQKPKGLHKFVADSPTIYPILSKLPEKMKDSWFKFDHMYSDNSFDIVFSIINKKFNSIYDIGGNTGKFERICLKNNADITMLDLKENIDVIDKTGKFKSCKFHPVNVLDKNPDYPQIKNSAVFMSQFLDCFSKKDIVKILTDLRKVIDDNSSVFILEPYTDNQNFEGAQYSLIHSSLYFTCMANGVSKFYTLEEMKEIIKKAGFEIADCTENIGAYDYTLLECRKNEMVSD